MMPAASHSRIPRAREGGALKLHRGATFGEVSGARLPPTATRIASPIPTDWRGPCHKTYITRARGNGVAALSAGGSGRGGARNRADRESHALTTAQIGNLKAAERHSRLIGLPLTRMLTIHWEAAGQPFRGMAKATGRFLDLLTKWLKRKGRRTAWLWVHENGDGKGWHAHILAHVPADLVQELTGKVKGWLSRITGKTYRKSVIHSKPIGKRLGVEVTNPSDHAINLEAALAYVLKGASPEAASQFALERLEPGGRVIGKRCGTSQNIGAKARKASQ